MKQLRSFFADPRVKAAILVIVTALVEHFVNVVGSLGAVSGV